MKDGESENAAGGINTYRTEDFLDTHIKREPNKVTMCSLCEDLMSKLEVKWTARPTTSTSVSMLVVSMTAQ